MTKAQLGCRHKKMESNHLGVEAGQVAQDEAQGVAQLAVHV